MASDLHLDPDRLHTHGRRLASILDALVPLPDLDDAARVVMASRVEGSAILSEFDRMTETVGRACRELAVLGAALHDTATAASAADVDAARTIAEPLS